MAARLSAFLVWAALAASAVFWVLKFGGGSPQAPGHTAAVGPGVNAPADLTRLFGAAPVAPPTDAAPAVAASSRFQLLGVVAPRGAARPAVALIAVDGNPPRPYRIGSVIDGDLVLQGVEPRAASIGPSGAAPAFRLELPPPPTAATGSLPPPAPGLGAVNRVAPPAVAPAPRGPAPANGVAPPATMAPAPPADAPEQPAEETPPPPGDDRRTGGVGAVAR